MSDEQIRVLEGCAGLEDVHQISVDFPFQCICPVPGLPYGGTISLSYVPQDQGYGTKDIIEWNSLASWIESLREEAFTAEQLTAAVVGKLWDAVRPEELRVELFVTSEFHLPVKVVAYRDK